MGKVKLPDLTIASGATESDELSFQDLRHLASLVILAPDTLPEAVTVEITGERDPVSADWRTLTQVDGTDVPIAAGKATPVPDVAFYTIRLVAGTSVAADRVFGIIGSEAP